MEEGFVLWAAPIAGFIVSLVAMIASKISATRFEKKWGKDR
ncbi:MAG TPA: hypothetical protein VIG90_09570 [Pedomonas sp.]